MAAKELCDGLVQQQAQKLIEQTTGSPSLSVVRVQAGCYNLCVTIDTKSGLFVLRTPKSPEVRRYERGKAQEEMNDFAPGVTLFLRTPEQQETVMTRATKLNLKTAKCFGRAGKTLLIEHVPGIPLDDYAQQEPEHISKEVIKGVLSNLHKSHKNGIVIGDRWTRNTHIIDDRDHSELDYDFYLRGNRRTTKAMDLAQTLYHLLHFSHGHREFMRDALLDIYAQNPHLVADYHLNRVREVLIGQTEYFHEKFKSKGTLYEGFIPPLTEAFELMEGMEEIKRFNAKLIKQGATLYKPAPHNTLQAA
jgi:tRNA A-37 threonylcarbamoyl transferase component Bud32